MSATGFTPIQLYRTTTAAAAPVSGNLSAGEIAINVNDADMALYAKNNTGNVKRLINNPAGLKYPTADGTAGQFVVTNASGVLSFSSTLVAPILGTPASGTLTNCTFPTLNQNTTGTAANVTGVVTVTHGGTGLATLAANRIPYGNGTGALLSSNALRFDTALRGSYGAGAQASNFAAGDNTLLSNTTGIYNTAIGFGSLQLNTMGSSNSAVGDNTLSANTTGSCNTAIGDNALSSNTVGSSNSAMGNNALEFNTTGYWNTAIGDSALQVSTTGDYNTAVGYFALSNNTTGSNNSAVGNNSLLSNTIGVDNSAVGDSTLKFNTTGSSNSAFGDASLYSNTTGDYNTATGDSALLDNTTGNNNLAIGSRALTNNTTGSNNSAAGYNTGLGITTGSGNTIVGANVTGLSATLTNNIILANGTGSIRVQSNGITITFADVIKPPQATTAAAPAYVKGGMYFDTTLNKMRIGGATAWETVSST